MELAPGAGIAGLYEIDRPIGKGGTSIVYAARHVETGETVALKLLALGGDAGEAELVRRRFFRELVVVARVRHPHVVAIRDFGVHDGAPYLVMDLLRGRTLHRHLRTSGPLSERRVARLFPPAIEALAEAHARGVVHQDLKPSNLFLHEHGDGSEDLVLLDWGIARRLQERSPVEEWAATPRYAAPEYLRRGEVRPALDVYQMGLAIAEALAGRPLVAPTEPAACLAVHLRGVPLPSEVLAGRFGPVIERALRRDPEERWRDGGALLVAFLEAVDDDDAPTRRLGAPAERASEDSEPSRPSLPALPPAPAAVHAREAPLVLAVLAVVVGSLAAGVLGWLIGSP